MVYLRIRVKINVSEDQEKDARKVVFGCFEIVFRASCINAKPYKEQGWEKKVKGEHSFLNGCSFRGTGITAT